MWIEINIKELKLAFFNKLIRQTTVYSDLIKETQSACRHQKTSIVENKFSEFNSEFEKQKTLLAIISELGKITI